MQVIHYDGSFAGLLTAVFEVYTYKYRDVQISVAEKANSSLFSAPHIVVTSGEKAARVYKKLQQKLSQKAIRQMQDCFLSEIDGIENVLLRYMQAAIDEQGSIENNFANSDVLMLQQMSKKVHRERHRMVAFVRFQLTKDGLYYAIVQPDYNVLPLLRKHFADRYADQRWLIYDALRKYGIYYDGNTVEEVQMQFHHGSTQESIANICDEGEELYQQLWKQYFTSINIKARENMRLHIQHMPRRYWKYLIEKK